MAGVHVGVGCRIHWAGVMGTGLGGGLSFVRFSSTMVTLGVNVGGVSVGTLRDGTGKSVFSTPAGASRGVLGVTSVGGFSVTFVKERESVCMAVNCSLPSITNGVGVGCKRALSNAGAAVVAALVELPVGTGQLCGENSTVLAIRSARVRGMYMPWHR